MQVPALDAHPRLCVPSVSRACLARRGRVSLREPRGRHYRRTGALVCTASILAVLAMLAGVRRGSYWAPAIPVGMALGALSGTAFWVGWTLAFSRLDPPAEEPD